METRANGPLRVLNKIIMQMQSNSRKQMSTSKGRYLRQQVPLKKLNVSARPVRVKSTNETMSRMKGKAFSATRRTQKGPTNKSPKAVSKLTSGRPGAGRNAAGKKSGINTSRVQQISPAQRGTKKSPTSKTVAINPRGQNKVPRSNGPSFGAIKKSLRKSMGY